MEQLNLWFLLLSVFLPRISRRVDYILDCVTLYNMNGWVPPTLGVLVPRALVLILMFQDRGMSPWLLVHGIAMGLTYPLANF